MFCIIKVQTIKHVKYLSITDINLLQFAEHKHAQIHCTYKKCKTYITSCQTKSISKDPNHLKKIIYTACYSQYKYNSTYVSVLPVQLSTH